MKNRIYCTFILSIIAVMVCAQTEQPKDVSKGSAKLYLKFVRNCISTIETYKQTVLFRTTPDKLQPVTV